MSRNEPSPAGTSDEDAKDVRLMQLVSAGETVAFEELVERHQHLVVGTVARMLGSNSDVEDLLKRCSCGFGKVPNAMPRGRSSRRGCRKSPVIWFSTNCGGDLATRNSPLQVESEDEERPLKDDRAMAQDASLLEQELQRAVETAIAQLPETQRMAVVLRRYDELSYEEIAEVLDQSVPPCDEPPFSRSHRIADPLEPYSGELVPDQETRRADLSRESAPSQPHILSLLKNLDLWRCL